MILVYMLSNKYNYIYTNDNKFNKNPFYKDNVTNDAEICKLCSGIPCICNINSNHEYSKTSSHNKCNNKKCNNTLCRGKICSGIPCMCNINNNHEYSKTLLHNKCNNKKCNNTLCREKICEEKICEEKLCEEKLYYGELYQDDVVKLRETRDLCLNILHLFNNILAILILSVTETSIQFANSKEIISFYLHQIDNYGIFVQKHVQLLNLTCQSNNIICRITNIINIKKIIINNLSGNFELSVIINDIVSYIENLSNLIREIDVHIDFLHNDKYLTYNATNIN